MLTSAKCQLSPPLQQQPGSSCDAVSGYVQDVKAVSEAVKLIQQHCANIRRETNMLSSNAGSVNERKARVQDAKAAAKSAMEEADRRLKAFPTCSGRSTSEQNHKRLTCQKLSESLVNASQMLESALHRFELAMAERLQRDAAIASATSADGKRYSTSEHPGVEALSTMEAGEGPQLGQQQQQQQQRQQQELDVSQAEADMHAAIVDEYAAGVTAVTNDMASLRVAMVDLARHAQAQGLTLDTVEGNMANAASAAESATKELSKTERYHKAGTKIFFRLLFLAAMIAASLIVIVVRRHG